MGVASDSHTHTHTHTYVYTPTHTHTDEKKKTVLFSVGLTVEVSTRAVGQHEAEIDVDHATPSIQQDIPVVAVFYLSGNMHDRDRGGREECSFAAAHRKPCSPC